MTEYFAEIKRQEEWKTHCEVLKEMCDTLCKMRAYSLEKDNYSMKAIQSISRGDQSFSFGFGDDGSGHSKYDARFMTRENRYCAKELHGEGMWMFEAGEVDQQIWNYNGNTWRFKQHEAMKSHTVNVQPETVDIKPEIMNDVDETVTKTSESVIEETENVTDLPCDTCGHEVQGCCSYDTEDAYCVRGNKWTPKELDAVETVEADIIQTVPDNTLFKRVPIGLTDANGKQICEGDILLHGSDTYHVHWYQRAARFVAEAVERKYRHADMEE
jgi:hypothetical protein